MSTHNVYVLVLKYSTEEDAYRVTEAGDKFCRAYEFNNWGVGLDGNHMVYVSLWNAYSTEGQVPEQFEPIILWAEHRTERLVSYDIQSDTADDVDEDGFGWVTLAP